MENFKHAFDMERSGIVRKFVTIVELNGSHSYVYYTQIMQAETLSSAYRLWRREWRGKGREYTAGALVWQVCLFDNPSSSPHTLHYSSMTVGL